MERDMLIREISNLEMNRELPIGRIYFQPRFEEFEVPKKKQTPQKAHKLNKDEVLQIQKILKLELGIDEVSRTGKLDSKTVKYLEIYLPNGLWRKFNYGEIKKRLLDEKKAIIYISGKANDVDINQLPTSIDNSPLITEETICYKAIKKSFKSYKIKLQCAPNDRVPEFWDFLFPQMGLSRKWQLIYQALTH